MLTKLRKRYPRLDAVLTVQDRVSAVGGGPLSSSIALAGFLSLFPLLLVAIAILGFLAAGDADLATNVVDDLGLEGKAAEQVVDAIDAAEDSRQATSVVGLLGLAWAGLGVTGALQAAMNATWQVSGRGAISKLFGVAWLVGAGALFLGSMSLGPAVAVLPGPAIAPTVILGIVLNTVLFLWMFRTLTNVHVPWRAHLPGAILGGMGLEILKLVGSVYVPNAVESSSALYGSLGVVFAILAWLALSARLVVYAAAFNVVRYERSNGTVTVELEVPRIAGEVPVAASRGGAVRETAHSTDGAGAR
jgi:membrane protein